MSQKFFSLLMLDSSQRCTKSEPKDAGCWRLLAFAYDYFKRYDDEIEAYRQALRNRSEEFQLLGQPRGHLSQPQALR